MTADTEKYLKGKQLPQLVLNSIESELDLKVFPDCVTYKVDFYETPSRENNFYPYTKKCSGIAYSESEFLREYAEKNIYRFTIHANTKIALKPLEEQKSVTDFSAEVIAVIKI